MLDPTASKGNAGRNWQSISWLVSATAASSSSSIDVNAISSFLNAHYTSDTNSFVVIPGIGSDVHSLLTIPGNYVFSLKLIIFFGMISLGTS